MSALDIKPLRITFQINKQKESTSRNIVGVVLVSVIISKDFLPEGNINRLLYFYWSCIIIQLLLNQFTRSAVKRECILQYGNSLV